MKKKNDSLKKLSLKKETLMKLDVQDMKNVKGGFTSIKNCTGWTCTAGSTRSSNLCICGEGQR